MTQHDDEWQPPGYLGGEGWWWAWFAVAMRVRHRV
jgi:hypothetical protein